MAFEIRVLNNKTGREILYSVLPSRLTTIKTNRAGTAPNKKADLPAGLGFCEYPFTQFNITTDGRVSKCCADLFFDEVMGNVKEEGILDIWRGENSQLSKIRGQLVNTPIPSVFYPQLTTCPK